MVFAFKILQIIIFVFAFALTWLALKTAWNNSTTLEEPSSEKAELTFIEHNQKWDEIFIDEKFSHIILYKNTDVKLEFEVDSVKGTEMPPLVIEDNEKRPIMNMNKPEAKNAAEKLATSQVDQSKIEPKDGNTMSKNTTRVLIMTHHRSGSSFTGELFNQHPDAFYMYEPLRIVDGGCTSSTTKLRTELLRNFMDCNFPNLQEMFPNMHKGHEHYTDVKGNFVFRFKNSRLCKPPFCQSDYSSAVDSKQCSQQCPDVETDQVRAVCVNKIPVIKTLRICDFEILKPLIDEGFNLRIMMLARDPRGIFNSRRKIFAKIPLEEVVNNMNWACRQTNKNMEDLDKFPWLKERVRNKWNLLC